MLTIPNISFDVIEEFCVDHRLLTPSQDDLFKLHEKLTFPKFYTPRNPDKETRQWWKKLKISDMWKQSAAAKNCLRVLADEATRELVEYIIISPLTFEEINIPLPPYVSKIVFELYRHYFFDLSKLSSDDLHNFLKTYGGFSRSIAACTDKSLAEGLFQFITKGQDIGASSGALSKRIMDTVALRILQLKLGSPSRDDARALKAYANTLQVSQSVYNDSNAASEELLELFLTFKHGSEKEEIPTYDQLLEERSLKNE